MPYSTRTRDRILRRPIAAQNTIPDQDIWYQRMADAEQARYDDEDYNWYLQNRGVMQPDGSYFGEELKPAPRLDYDPRVRQVGQPMRDYEAYGDYDRRLMENVGDLVLGYDPREGSPDYEYENPSAMDKAMFAGVFAPGAVGRVAGAALGADIAYDIARGRHVPGALDMMWLGGMGARAARNAYRAGRAFKGGYQAGRARRAAEQAARARALEAPKKRIYDVTSRRWREISPYIEEVPYEEVRF